MLGKIFSQHNERIAVNENHPLGSAGAQGTVYSIKSPRKYIGYCVKIFHKNKISPNLENRINFMVNNTPRELSTPQYLVCWPISAIYINGNFSGYIMPIAEKDSILLYEISTLKFKSSSVGIKWSNKFDRKKGDGIMRRLMAIVNLCIPIHIIHKTGKYVIVDLKPQNVLISFSGRVSIIDTDSIQISNNTRVIFSALVSTPEYSPPESKKIDINNTKISKDWDLFSLAVIAYEILIGIHPFTGTCKAPYNNLTTIQDRIPKGLSIRSVNKNLIESLPPQHSNFNRLPKKLKDLFEEAFYYGHHNPSNRPSAEKWGAEIFNLIKKKDSELYFYLYRGAIKPRDLVTGGFIKLLTENIKIIAKHSLSNAFSKSKGKLLSLLSQHKARVANFSFYLKSAILVTIQSYPSIIGEIISVYLYKIPLNKISSFVSFGKYKIWKGDLFFEIDYKKEQIRKKWKKVKY